MSGLSCEEMESGIYRVSEIHEALAVIDALDSKGIEVAKVDLLECRVYDTENVSYEYAVDDIILDWEKDEYEIVMLLPEQCLVIYK